MLYIYTKECYSAIKKNKMTSFTVTWMETVILSKVSQRKTKIYDITCMWNLKKIFTNELIYKTEIQSQMWKTNFWLYIKWVANKGLLCSTEKNKPLPVMQETQVQSLCWEDPLEKGMANYSGILERRIPRIEEFGRLQSIGSQRVRHN